MLSVVCSITDNEPCSEESECAYEMYFDDISDGNPDSRGRLLNKRCQISVLLFIDGASYIRTNELGWRGFFLFKHDKRNNHYTLLGFCTAYEFWHAPDSIRFRISQILVFPPYQRRGHGSSSNSVVPHSSLFIIVDDLCFDSEVC